METVLFVALAAVGLLVVVTVLFGLGFIVGCALAAARGSTSVDHDAIVYAEGYADGQAARG